jgi:phosphoribosylaminoimidazolecarboxamide formyltransferase/IMP cyclohydrolase
MGKIKRALISVSDKTGIVDLARGLADLGAEILSTGGTAKALRDAGVPVKDVSEHTGFPEMMGGRLKTLHPRIHGGLLGRRDNKDDLEDMRKHGIEPIDMVVVNLYPFERAISREGVTFNEAIENIDIGGPTMLRSAAKNFRDVAVVVDPGDYRSILGEIVSLNGTLSYQTRVRLARKVFEHTSRYDNIIAGYLARVSEEKEEGFPETLTMSFRLGPELRYGENPHQTAASYVEATDSLSIFNAKILQGKAMSFNNYFDAHSALMLALEFEKPVCAIIKHNNPCGVATAEGPAEAYVKAAKTDPVSAFGGVLAFNTPVDGDAAREMAGMFVEAVLAPGFTEEALKVFSGKPDVRVLELPDMRKILGGFDIKRIAGGLLVQEWDKGAVDVRTLEAVTKREPTREELDGLDFAWKVCKHVKSNAIVYAFKDRTVGIGIGQTSRVYSARTGAINALEPLMDTVVASDGFFPFRDGIDGIKKVGVNAVIQPGGSLRDEEVIRAADEQNMAMLFTGMRHFRH